MLIQDKIKLDIYESVLDDSDKSELIEIVESTDDINVLNDVVDILESTRLMREEEKKSQELKMQKNKYKDLVNESSLKARKYGDLSSDESLSPNVRKRASELKEQSLKKADEYNKLADFYHLHRMGNLTSLDYGKRASKALRRGLFLDYDMDKESGKNAKKYILKRYGIDKKRNEREPGKFLMK